MCPQSSQTLKSIAHILIQCQAYIIDKTVSFTILNIIVIFGKNNVWYLKKSNRVLGLVPSIGKADRNIGLLIILRILTKTKTF